MEFTDKQKKEIANAKGVLHEGEQVLDVSTGMVEARRLGSKTKRNGTVLVTDRRVVLFTKKLGGHEVNDHAYNLLTTLDYKRGAMFGDLVLSSAGDQTRVSMIPKADIERIATTIRKCMAEAYAGGAQVTKTVSAADEIKKLAELHTAGILTDEEFTAKKRQLLDL